MTSREKFITALAKSGLTYAVAARVTGIDAATLKKWKFRTGEPWLRTAEAMECATRALDMHRERNEARPPDVRTITLPEAEWQKLNRLRGRHSPDGFVALMIRLQMEPQQNEPEIKQTVWTRIPEKPDY